MELKVLERDDGITHVALIGSLDIQGLHKVDTKFHGATAACRRPTIVDMSQVDFISSLAMGMLISCAKSLQRHGVRMVLVNPQQMVADALKVARLDSMLPMVQDADEAVQMARAT